MVADEKDKAAQSMARKRWDKQTPEQRSEYARKMNAARWGGPKKKKRKAK